ncbi:MAG: hypothetical protein II897_04125 [Clostridia bacterium]|nr:hypothetical protein [Clostridia bacterium]
MSSVFDIITNAQIVTIPDNPQKVGKLFKVAITWLRKTLDDNPILFNGKDVESFLKTSTLLESRVMYLKAKQEKMILSEEEY